ncbi:PREDICTED: uncharacterized protein LOC109223642 [Nicotiana attenuata]|uniref:Thylakoid soluble phosphoprotein TSP9 n=1 Tax=Nicotiana attenuata TaxID=49451 RepID=A0A1J6IW44_NICAT|nr:PREDICTED: uncharacterized protein LOC109223642 [Nicotiana attenuata]OIT04808.1 hypothetical protein A4A49_24651 [Nicotiana attenuata]
MASLNLFNFTPIATAERSRVYTASLATTERRRVYTAATAAKSSGGNSEEKSLLDFILGSLQKEDQLLEVDPILKKVEGKSVGTTSRGKNSVAVPPKKNSNGGGFGGFGGLFAKKD